MQSLQVKTSESAFTKPTWTQEEQAIWNSIEEKLDHIKKDSQEYEKYLEENN
ncbi:hypothetical protein Noda2021_07830 [Candidatus Dependentiae bacterium Noda2021]|nr:hypothetical protein Noda2021_07830 [Candidatus Dependentiae bacterium Noda2021]